MATNTSHWLKVQSRWFKYYIFAKKCIYISFWVFQYCFYDSFTLYYCANYFTLWMLDFFDTIRLGCQTVWIQIRLDKMSGSKLFAKVVCRQQKSPLVGKELNTKQLAETTFWLKSWLKLISFFSNFFHLAKVLATTNSEPR